jgi:DNA polymerase III alpha subunit
LLVDHFERTTREGKKMMVVRLEDETDQVSPALFEGDYPEVMPPLETPLVCKFRVTKGFDSIPPRIRLEQFFTLEDFRNSKIKQAELRFAVPDQAATPESVVSKIKNVLADQRGNTKIRLVLEYPEAKVVLSGERLRATLTNDLFQRIAQLQLGGARSRITYM